MGSKTYVDNAYNRSLGRVGKPLGSHPVSNNQVHPVAPVDSSVATSTYVDTCVQSQLGRVGESLIYTIGSSAVPQQLACWTAQRRMLITHTISWACGNALAYTTKVHAVPQQRER